MAINTEIFLGSGATTTLVPELDLTIVLDSSSTTTQLIADATWTDNVLFVEDLYVGCMVDLYDGAADTYVSSHMITGNDTTSVTITPAHSHGTLADNDDYMIIRNYAAPCPTTKSSSTARLNADNWLGLVESLSFPNVDVEMKQLNLNLGGTRGFTHQYKGIKTASGGNINLAANHGAFLYYALGACTRVNCTTTGSSSLDPATNYSAHTNNVHYIDIGETATAKAFSDNLESHTDTGPIFYRTATGSTFLLPPVLVGQDIATQMALLTLPEHNAGGTLLNPIQYTFSEGNTNQLPSFALENSISKLESSNTYKTGDTSIATESHTFVRIARGNRVNTLTMTANENEELKMTLDLNTAAVNKLKTSQSYEARAGQTSNTALFNYGSGSNTLAATGEESLDPFFFSKGSFSIFGVEFLKITNLSLTINNNIQDKRFVGIGNKDIKHGIPAQRNYELSFTALITDNKLFEELFTETEVVSSSSTIDLQFDKDNGEQIVLKFEDYHINAANVTIPEDRGPITVEATVMPRTLNTCTVKTHWILQG